MKKWIKRAFVALSCTFVGMTALGVASACSLFGKECEHTWNDGEVKTAATCTADGEKLLTCTKCQETKTETIPMGHQYEVEVTTATCQHGGMSKYTCSACGDSYQDNEVGVVACSYTMEETKATCIADGYKTYTCEWCEDSYNEITERADGHNTTDCTWVSAGDEQVSGCKYKHIETTTCADCGETVTHEAEFERHEYAVSITTVATCTTKGVKTYTCDECQDNYTQEFESATAHAWVKGETNAQTGVTTYTCSHNAAHTKTSFSAKDKIEATIPAEAIQAASEIELQNAAIALDEKVKEQLGDKAIDLSVATLDEETKAQATQNMTAEEKAQLANAPIFNFEMTQDSQAVTTFNGNLTVTVPYDLEYGADSDDIAVWYIDNTGKTKSIQATYSEVDGQGYATFTTNHFSYYTVVRLSAAERCALYGHENTTTVIAATCEEDGYTLTRCKRCHRSERSNFVKAHGHSNTSKVTAPTCTERGYTTYTCTTCGDKLVTDYVATIAHDYADKVVAPTCTTDGYTVHTCKACGVSYTDSATAATGHSYADGACSVCGRLDPNAATETNNFYFNLFESLATAETYYVEIPEYKITQISADSDGYSGEMRIVYENMKLMIGVDENGFLYGKGIAQATTTSKEYNDDGTVAYDEKVAATVKVVLRDGYIYVDGSGVYDGEDAVVCIDQNYFLDELVDGEGTAAENLMKTVLAAEEWQELAESIKAVKDNPLNKVLEVIFEYVFNKQTTDDGYAFTLNANRLTDVYKVIKEQTVEGVFNTVFGTDAYAEVVDYLVASVDKKVGEVIDDLETKCNEAGVTPETVYSLVNTIVNGTMATEDGEKFDIRTMLAQYEEMTVVELLNGFSGEEATAADYKALIEEYADGLKNAKLLDMLLRGESGEEDKRPTTSASAGYMSDSDTTGETDEIYEMLVEIVKQLEKSKIQFHTDKAGNLLSVNVDLKEIGDQTTREELLEEVQNEWEEDYNWTSHSAVMIESYKMNFVPNGNFAEEFEDVVTTAKEHAKVIEFDKSMILENSHSTINVNGDEHPNYYLIVDETDGDVYLWNYDFRYAWRGDSEVEVLGTETYNQKTCTKISVTSRHEFYELGATMVLGTTDCHGWYEYEISWRAIENARFTAWMTEDGEIVGVELANEEYEYYYERTFPVVYNPQTGEYAAKSQHNYKLSAHKDAEGCTGVGYDQYTCSVCGDSYKETYTNGHKTKYRYELKEGSTTCEDGVWEIMYCTVCNKELNRWSYTDHYTYTVEKTLTTTGANCPDLTVYWYECACGEEKNGLYGLDDGQSCLFNWVDEESWNKGNDGDKTEHWFNTYRCAATDCGYTYTRESYYISDKANCKETYYKIYKVGVKADGSCDFTWTETHVYDYHNTKSESSTDAQGRTTYKSVCQTCQKVTDWYTRKSDEYGREIYYYNHLGKYGWERVYSADCSYTYYELDETGNRGYSHTGMEHAWGWYYYNDSCSQYQYHGELCRACGAETGSWDSPRGHNYVKGGDTYYCTDCGLENKNGVDGLVVIEDMEEDGVYKAGYYNRANVQYEVYIVVNYGTENDEYLETVKITDVTTHGNSGIVTVDMESLAQAIKALGDDVEVSTVSIVFQYVDPASSNEGGVVDHAITFDY